jgi:hypothetical protein
LLEGKPNFEPKLLLKLLILDLLLGFAGGGMIMPLVSSVFSRLGGSGGNEDSPHAGALTRLPPAAELTEVDDVLSPTVDAVDKDVSDVIDSKDGLRGWSVGRRTGSAGREAGREGVGGGSFPDLRVGKGGGGFLGFRSGVGDFADPVIEGGGRSGHGAFASAG